MDNLSYFGKLLEIGRSGHFGKVQHMLSFLGPDNVRWGADIHHSSLMEYAVTLSPPDLVVFVKAVAALEHPLNLLSVSTLQYLFPLLQDSDRRLALEWILPNTRSYRYFSQAKSIEEFDAIARKTAVNIKTDRERQARDMLRTAEEATERLENAVRRGDAKALHALLKKGANPRTTSTDGMTLPALARNNGHESMATNLEEIIAASVPPSVSAVPGP